MFLFIYKTLKILIAAIRGSDSPKQIGFGIALGMMIGFLPKDSAFAMMFGLFVFATSVNLLATTLSVITFALIGSLCDPLFHQVGFFVLTHENLEATWIWLYQQPFSAWTRFNNTVVMGSLLVGLFLMFPIYYYSTGFFEANGARFSRTLTRFWLFRVLAGKKKMAELAGAES